MTNGLKINDVLIKKLSGPVSAYLLTPKKDSKERMEKMGINLDRKIYPRNKIIILFLKN